MLTDLNPSNFLRFQPIVFAFGCNDGTLVHLSKGQWRIALGDFRSGALGTATHFETGDNSSTIALDELSAIGSFDLRVASVKIVRLNSRAPSENPRNPVDDIMLCLQMGCTTVSPVLENRETRSCKARRLD